MPIHAPKRGFGGYDRVSLIATPKAPPCVETCRMTYRSSKWVKFNYSHYSEYWLLQHFIIILPYKPCTTVQAVMWMNP